MASDDRDLRDRLEELQVSTKQLRAELDDPERLAAVAAEAMEEVEQLKVERAALLPRLERLKAEAEEARMRSMQVKRLRADQHVLPHVGAAGRVLLGVGLTLGAGIAGVHYGAMLGGLPAVGTVACAAGACGFIAWVYRIAADLRR